jgi:hypothetical protein
MRRPLWRGLLAPGAVREDRWACPPEPVHEPVVAVVTRAGPQALPAEPERVPAAPPSVEARRLEQHFFYNALNTIGSLIRTDPARARDLLDDFAGLSRAADRTGPSTLGRELEAVHEYLRLEQARFGRRLQVAVDVAPGLDAVPVDPMRVLALVRDAVQQGVEPLPEGGLLSLTARPVGAGCEVRVTGGSGAGTVVVLPA